MTGRAEGNIARLFVHLGRRSLIYGALLIGSTVFLWPFLWMVGTSFKSGQEVFSSPGSVLPQRTVPRVRSPYIDTRQFAAPATEAARELLPLVGQRLREVDYPWPSFGNRQGNIRGGDARGLPTAGRHHAAPNAGSCPRRNGIAN